MRLNVQLSSTHKALGPTPRTNNNNNNILIYSYMDPENRVPNPVFNPLYT